MRTRRQADLASNESAQMSFGKARSPAYLIALVGLVSAVLSSNTVAQVIGPSFNCQQAGTPDEQTICRDRRLAELDQTMSAAFNQVDQSNKQAARYAARELLTARRACGADRLCILDQQVNAIETFAAFGAPVAVPSWVGAYRVTLFAARREAPASGMPTRIGQCSLTRIASIGSRFGDELKPPSADRDNGTAVTFTNRGGQVSYTYVEAVAKSRIGDEILVCLVSVPKDCPPGDNRGKVYSATNLRTKESWLLPDSQHMCGGA